MGNSGEAWATMVGQRRNHLGNNGIFWATLAIPRVFPNLSLNCLNNSDGQLRRSLGNDGWAMTKPLGQQWDFLGNIGDSKAFSKFESQLPEELRWATLAKLGPRWLGNDETPWTTMGFFGQHWRFQGFFRIRVSIA